MYIPMCLSQITKILKIQMSSNADIKNLLQRSYKSLNKHNHKAMSDSAEMLLSPVSKSDFMPNTVNMIKTMDRKALGLKK